MKVNFIGVSIHPPPLTLTLGVWTNFQVTKTENVKCRFANVHIACNTVGKRKVSVAQ